jgi:hypothetical protein
MSVTFTIPDFVSGDGIVFSEIEITIESDDADVSDTLRLRRFLIPGPPSSILSTLLKNRGASLRGRRVQTV